MLEKRTRGFQGVYLQVNLWKDKIKLLTGGSSVIEDEMFMQVSINIFTFDYIFI